VGSSHTSLARKFVPALVLAVLVSFGIALYADAPSLIAALRSFDLTVLPLTLFLASLHLVVRFVRWHYYLVRLSVGVPRGLSAGVFLSGLSMSITPGKLGELLKCFMLRDRIGARIATTAPVVVAERYTDIVGVLVLVAIGATRFPGGGPVLVAGGVVAIVLLVVLSVSDKMVDRAGSLLSGTLMKGRSLETTWARESGVAFRSLLQGRSLAIGSFLGALAWYLECVAFLVVLRGFGETGVTLLGATFTYATATLAGALSMLPGGLGATEGGMAVLLARQGVGRDVAAGATLVIRACTLWWGVGIGAIAYLAQATIARQALEEAVSEESAE
jgi:glycosyltransferase 2 family protein